MRLPAVLVLAGALCAPAFGQTTAAPVPCPAPDALTSADLWGLWRAEFEDGGPGATVLLERNPNWAGSFAGGINRNGERGRVAGDVDAGEFTMEESADGQRIAATWLGDVVATSCGREVRGTWQPRDGAPRRFVLRRIGGG